MHGDKDSPDEAVLTKDDYETYDDKKELFSTALRGDLLSKTFLFIGFSFDDPNLQYILSRIKVLLKGNTPTHYCFSFVILALFTINAQNGTVEAEQVIADSLKGIHIGDGSRLYGLQSQNLSVSETGDTLHISEGNWVIIPGISSSNSGTAFANAGPDIVNACETSFNLQASPPASGSRGQWEIISGTGGNLVNPTLHNTLFVGQEGER